MDGELPQDQSPWTAPTAAWAAVDSGRCRCECFAGSSEMRRSPVPWPWLPLRPVSEHLPKVVAEVSDRPQHLPSSAFPADESLAQHHGLNHMVVVASTHLARHPRVGHEPLLRGASWAVCVVPENNPAQPASTPAATCPDVC